MTSKEIQVVTWYEEAIETVSKFLEDEENFEVFGSIYDGSKESRMEVVSTIFKAVVVLTPVDGEKTPERLSPEEHLIAEKVDSFLHKEILKIKSIRTKHIEDLRSKGFTLTKAIEDWRKLSKFSTLALKMWFDERGILKSKKKLQYRSEVLSIDIEHLKVVRSKYKNKEYLIYHGGDLDQELIGLAQARKVKAGDGMRYDSKFKFKPPWKEAVNVKEAITCIVGKIFKVKVDKKDELHLSTDVSTSIN